jgi:hypothetical protein
LTSLNLASNSLGQLALPEGWEEHESSKGYFRLNGGEWTQSVPAGAKAEGIIALANAIPDMGALSVLSLKKNSLGTKEAGKVLGEMLKVNSALKELDLSDNGVHTAYGGDAPGFAQELALGIQDNGALTSLDLSSNDLQAGGAKIIAEAIKVLIMRLRSFWYIFLHVHLTIG